MQLQCCFEDFRSQDWEANFLTFGFGFQNLGKGDKIQYL